MENELKKNQIISVTINGYSAEGAGALEKTAHPLPCPR